jgi:hypothetical protein
MQIETPLLERSNLAAGRGGTAALCGPKKGIKYASSPTITGASSYCFNSNHAVFMNPGWSALRLVRALI